ncbi:M3 family metallopeptidase [Gallaecimonas pentaromativorans]|uniref:Peptidyl-dipeptidase Dcp n=1 Tax=Gallaecimonas pentaromativorans TaxID=584787 RepID=A0A3N1PMG2_9GAMM|nr:M3 family metallopeptidase [Gallaecimonas pentaromativorans]ROQ29773.1 peptidyl-dipeptidase Dcp [Gallaecimonas pentaromativorans]
MRKTLIASAIGAALALSACSDDHKAEQTSTAAAPAKEQTAAAMPAAQDNVLLQKSPLQYQAPQFDKITTADYLPAFEQGIKEHNSEIEAIANNSEAPTFDNTIVAMEKSGALLTRVSTVFGNLSGLVSNDKYQKIEEEMAPKLAAHSDNIYMNPKLFARVQAIYNNKDSLSKEDQRLAQFYYTNFVRAGAKLSDQDKAKLRDINGELAKLSSQFNTNILNSFKNETILVKDKSELAGLSDSEIASLAAAAKADGKDGYLITLVNTTRQPILGSLENRELRKKIWETSAHRAKDNDPVVLKTVELRAEKAKLLGYPNWAAYVLEDQMAKTPEAVFDILDKLAPKAVAKAKSEAADIQAEIKKDGGDFELQPWDWAFYAEKVRKAKYDLDESQVKPYFEFNTVLHDGLFYAMNKLYGITFKERKDLPVWNSNVMPFEVFDADGKSIGLFYEDPYARTGKNGGAWMSEWVTQSGLLGTHPVIYNALNIPKPAEGQPTLLTFDEVTTMFHEFGHALHGMFSNVKYPSLAGTATARDFVEFPSQFNEDWDINPEVIAHYAKNYKTGEPIPKELLDKVLAAHKFNQGFDTTEYLAAALLDMEWHSLPAGTEVKDIESFEHQALAKHGIDYAPVPPRYKTDYFSHIFSGGYSAGYYAYLWTEVFAADAFQYMKDNGGLTRENGDKFRENVLSKGNSQDLMQDYINFRGQKPTIDALLKRRGLN